MRSHAVHRPITKLIALGIAGAFMLAAAGAAFAAPQGQASSPKQGHFGSITTIGDSTFTIDSRQTGSLEISVTGDTVFRMPGAAEPAFSDLTEGSRVAVLVVRDGELYTASHVMTIPGEPRRQHRVLTVTGVSEGRLLAEDASGNQVEVELSNEPDETLVGEVITFIGERSQQSNRFKANVEVKIRGVVDRLDARAQQLRNEARSEANAERRAELERVLEDLETRLAGNMERHLETLERVLTQLPERAQERFEAVIGAARQRYSDRLEALGERAAQLRARLALETFNGTVARVNTGAGVLAVQRPAHGQVELNITADTRFDGVRGLDEIDTGSRVMVRYDGESMDAVEVRVVARPGARGGRP